MEFIDIILLPFVFIYKGFITVLLLPYYFLYGFISLFKKNEKKSRSIIPELKKKKEIKIIKGVRSVYDTPNTSKEKTSIKDSKEITNLKRQKEFEKLVAKARQEELKRIKEQEKLRIEREKKKKEKEKREAEIKRKEEELELRKIKKQEALRKNGQPVTFFEKIKSVYKKITYNKKEVLELEAKKAVLDEQFKDKKNNTSRFEKPLLFNYIAKNNKGEIEKNSIEALSRVDVHSFLLAEGYEVYEITAAKTVHSIFLLKFRFKRNRLIFYLTQLSAYLKAGIALADAVKILSEQAKNINEKNAWKAVYYDLSMGDVLSLALEKRGEMFPKLLVNMIKTAEMTGNLTETLDDMVEYYTESESTTKQMQSAMMYPVVVSIFAIVVITFILLWVVPQFVSMYQDMGSELPKITKLVVSISNFLKNYILIISVFIIMSILIYSYLFKNIKSFRCTMQKIAMRLPVFGNIIIYNEVTIFTKTFANLINHNVFITDSIDVLSKITDNEIYKKLIFNTAKNLTKGDTISKAFKDHWAFPNIAYQMLITGEKTGRLGSMMDRVSDYYQEQHRNIIDRMKSLIEPILIVSLSVIIGFILLSVIIPMFGMYDSL